MRLGIRLQLLLALGALLVLAFVPLFFAVASLTQATLETAREASARALGRAVAGHVAAAGAAHVPEPLHSLLDAQLGQEGVGAIGVYATDGTLLTSAGARDSTAALPSLLDPAAEAVTPVPTPRGDGLLVVVPAPLAGAVAVLMHIDPATSTAPSAPLVRLVALYTGVVALALLVAAYIVMTRLVVRPIDRLASAAERVASGAAGARSLDAPRTGARELVDLGNSLARMTERLRADEEALRAKIAEAQRTAKDLRRAQESLIRSERLASVGRLSAGLAHEIGNPLAAILGFQSLLLTGGLPPDEERDFLQRMQRETERIHRILRDLLDFARPASDVLAPSALGPRGARGTRHAHGARHAHGPSDASDASDASDTSDAPSSRSPSSALSRRGAQHATLMPARPPSGSIAEAIADVTSLVQPQKALRDITLAQEIAAALPPVPLAHERLVQVFLNLTMNAADAVAARWGDAPGGRITLRAALITSDVALSSEASSPTEGELTDGELTGGVRIEVEDNGAGIAPEIRDHLFEPFVTTKDVGQGTGLGLAVCRGLIDAAGGTLTVDDVPGGGARFVVCLPRTPVEP
ncbi:sensor histidine kinase [Chondromyces crocatus]|uniref:histidine kinase n=1 Tax=Chondromyces crocatus TaxID=52 RepID=A0A0K1E6F2_CHOCO|nr:HAMP domain-containing sensor histidine kinase [Chondromyces crocatus]AKT36262.1 sensor histidine kinase [Chondromyces crocatus]